MEIKGSRQLYNKLFFIYTVILVCVVSVLVIYFFTSTRNRFLKERLNYTEMMKESAISYLEDSSDIAEYIHEDLYKSNMELEDALHYMSAEPSEYQKYRLDTYIENKLREYKGIEEFFLDAFQAYQSLNHIVLYSYERDEMTEYTRDGKSYRKQGVEELKQRLGNMDLADGDGFSYMKEIRDPSTMQAKGCMLLAFRSKQFETLQQYYAQAEMAVYNDVGTAVFDSAGTVKVQNIMDTNSEGELEAFLGAYVEQAQSGQYHVICYLEKGKAAAAPVPVILMFFAVGVLAIAVGETCVRYYLRRLAGRLDRILEGMTKVMEGNLDVRIPVNKNGDELDVISRYFNEMCVKLDEHIKKQYLAEIEQKNAEMSALQSQINPHFLYNTLEAIRMKAISSGDREVGKMLYSLAVTFRAQIKEADVITLVQELHYCKKYMELFEFRYQNQFQAVVECPEEFFKVPVIKFVLQPVIENYFIHGMRMRDKDNRIRIYVEKGEAYRIVVEDNGRGMPEEELAEQNRKLREGIMEKRSSIGVANVNRRLKAVYGDEYGVFMEAVKEGGLRVILTFQPEGSREEDGEGAGDEESNVSGR